MIVMAVVNLHLDLSLMLMRRSHFGILCSRFGIAPCHNHNLADWPPLIQWLESALLGLVVFSAFCMLLLVCFPRPLSERSATVRRPLGATHGKAAARRHLLSAERQPDVPTT